MFNFYAKANKDDCNIRNLTHFVFQDLYAGIPDTLLLNVVLAIMLVIGFSIIRNHFDIIHRDKIKKRWSVMYNTTNFTNNVDVRHKAILTKQRRYLGPFNWILETIKLNKNSILKHCGPDALYYLSFQQHLLFVMGVMTCVSLFIALPVNLQGTIYRNATNTKIGRFTLGNLQPESEWLWFHVILSILYIPLIGIAMRKANIPKDFLKPHSRAIMITNISRNVRDKTVIKNHLKELFPNVTIEDVQLAYDISKLFSLNDEYEKAASSRRYCEIYQTAEKPIHMRSICTCKKTNAYEYYIDQEIILATKIAKLKETVLNNPLGIAFVTLSKVGDPQFIVSNFRSGSGKNWKISIAPTPLDIYYENLNNSPNKWYFKWYLANISLFLLLFFITTPAIIVNILNLLIISKHLQEIEEFSSVISHFLPTIILLLLKVIMPVLVSLTEYYMYHWTKSLEEFVIMTKTFGYLLFMTLILPSLGLTSIQALVEWTVDSTIKETNEYRWHCVFLPNNGAFFVNYVISSAFIGNLIDLIRFPDILYYCWLKMLSKSVAETTYIRNTYFIQFPFGIHYAWMILIFSICAVYSLICPLVTPCGVLYILIKYFCDKHNLYFNYAPADMIEKSAERIHQTASTFTIYSSILVLILLSAFITMRAQGFDAKSLLLIIAIIITLMLFMFTTISNQYGKKKTSIEKIMPPISYFPKILKD